ncbi:DEAD/DEAH box helicase [Streptomyces sp. NPDC051555]|uniref:DEAD/DEAH box helicase n=1 Tax=Streptomyces sp. NPDC051555 TaxID=3365657 RepID=UPI0037BC36FD
MAPRPDEASALLGCSAFFLPAPVPREGLLAFHSPTAGFLPVRLGPVEDLTVAAPYGRGARRRTVPVLLLPVREALPLLAAARDADGPGGALSPAVTVWRAASLFALRMAGRGRLLPGLTDGDLDAWRIGPYEAEDVRWVRALADAMPPTAYGAPLDGAGPVRLPDPHERLRAYLDAIADLLPRTAAAAAFTGTEAFSGLNSRAPLPEQRVWAAEVAHGADSGVRLSLRVELPWTDVYGSYDEGDEGDEGDGFDPHYTTPDTAPGPHSLRAALQLHSLADPTVLADAAEVWAAPADALPGFGPRTRIDTMLALRRAARVWEPLGRILDRPVPDALELSDDELADLLQDAAERLDAAGIAVHWPKDLVRELLAHAVVEPVGQDRDAEAPAFFSPEQLLAFRWEFAAGDQTLTQAELDRLAEAHRPLVRLRDQWVVVDAALIRKARERERTLSAFEGLTAALTGSVEEDGAVVPVHATGWLADLRGRLLAPDQGEASAPAALDATLRTYQLRGMAWLDRMTRLGFGACLADDMGLGKTVTLIALHLRRQEDPATAGPALVVCPASLLGNWTREIERFAPGTPVRRHHGQVRDLENLGGSEFVLTTYGTMRRDAALLAETGPWGLVVADEAQHVKNPAAATAKALRSIPSAARVALTGTPVENNLSELWALLDWTTPGLLGPLKSFRTRYGRAAERAAREEVTTAAAASGPDPGPAERLGRLVRPFLLRRKKSDPGIAPELPPKTETDQRVALTREQVSLYEAQVRESMAAIAAARGIARHGLVLKLLNVLKQICNHPAQYLKEPSGARLKGRSGKLDLLDELLDTILAEDGSVLVFSQYVQMARLLETHLASRGIPTLFLHGQTPVARREEMVDAFQRGEVPVFLLSLKAAGTGLNLTRAGHVVHFDRWWNPAVEDQATDRAYRIGQTQPVQVHRMVTEGTVEDRIADLLRSKRGLADAVLGGGEAALTDLTDAELADLVTLHRSDR